MTRIKICSICRPEDAALASAAGADAIGLIFHPASPRAVNVDQAGQILAACHPFVTPVGVFVDAGPDTVDDVALLLRLTTLQLHGQESPDDCRQLRARGYRILKALKVTPDLADDVDRYRHSIDAIVLDTASTKGHGGTGELNDWPMVERLHAEGLFANIPLIAAGGLTAETVPDVIRRLRPSAVDVSSGVEAALRQKSPDKVHAFVAAVRTQ